MNPALQHATLPLSEAQEVQDVMGVAVYQKQSVIDASARALAEYVSHGVVLTSSGEMLG